jgi:hypothetical protein
MPVGRRLPATLLLVASAACSDPFQAAPTESDAQSFPNPPDADALPPHDALAPLDAPMRSDVMPVDATDAGLSPPVSDGLLLWLRADFGVTEMKGTITNWADQSGHHADAVQTDTTKQPKFGPGGTSGQKPVLFDTDDFMSLPAGFDDFSQGISMFAVYYTDPAATCIDVLDFSNGTEVDDITLGRHDGHIHYEVLNNGASGDDFPIGVPTLASVVHAPDLSVELRVNAAPFTTANFDLPASVTRLSNVVGRSLYTDCGTVNGGVSEVLVYGRALGNEERARVESYLASRWNCCK